MEARSASRGSRRAEDELAFYRGLAWGLALSLSAFWFPTVLLVRRACHC